MFHVLRFRFREALHNFDAKCQKRKTVPTLSLKMVRKKEYFVKIPKSFKKASKGSPWGGSGVPPVSSGGSFLDLFLRGGRLPARRASPPPPRDAFPSTSQRSPPSRPRALPRGPQRRACSVRRARQTRRVKRHARARAWALPGDARGRDDTARPRAPTCATASSHHGDVGSRC